MQRGAKQFVTRTLVRLAPFALLNDPAEKPTSPSR